MCVTESRKTEEAAADVVLVNQVEQATEATCQEQQNQDQQAMWDKDAAGEDAHTLLFDSDDGSGSDDDVVDLTSFVDIDGVSECVDVLRGAGLTEGSDRLLCEGVRWLLDEQKSNGSWAYTSHGGKDANPDAYSLIHPTWVASQALRDRDYKIERRGNVIWKDFIAKIIKQTEFHVLEYEPKWNCKYREPKRRRASVAKKKKQSGEV